MARKITPEDLMAIAEAQVYCGTHGGYRDECHCPVPAEVTAQDQALRRLAARDTYYAPIG